MDSKLGNIVVFILFSIPLIGVVDFSIRKLSFNKKI